VAQCGPIAFVGLVVPHIIRLTLGHAGRSILLWSPLVGGTFLVLCDSIARVLLSDGELPVGVITAGIGAPMLIALIWFNRQQS
jgi:iron complex transport system permease protein